MDTDGTNVRRVTDNSSDDVHPTWSPDGSQIAFERYRDDNRDIWVVDADGGNPTNLTNSSDSDEGQPHWGPEPR